MILGFVFLSLSRAVMKRRAQTSPANSGSGQVSVSGSDLRQTLDGFLGAADSVDVDSIAAICAGLSMRSRRR
jgi:hypothetical protein